MPSPNKAKLTIFYTFEKENKNVTLNLDPCEIEMERGKIEIESKNGCHRFELTDAITIKLKGTTVECLSPRVEKM